MPYISEEDRLELDDKIQHLSDAIINTQVGFPSNPRDFSNYLGRINYCFSRIIIQVMRDISYSNIAMATGVLENIKQELYRRLASVYEDRKINENGDIPEYRKWS